MARMIPSDWHEKTPSSEQRIFQLLQQDPATSEWIVLHSLNLKQSGTRPYGEVDFVVLIPGAGVLCLEVKGGRIACRDGLWTSTDAAGRTYQLKRSPFKQAEDGMHEIRRALEERLQRRRDFYQVPFGHIVVFPDVPAPPLEVGTEPWEVIDSDALKSSLASQLLRAGRQQRSRLGINSSPPEPQAPLLKEIRDILRPDFERVIARSTIVYGSERHILRLTEEQYHVLDILAGNPRCLFEGAAGTGKTLLALEFSRRCAKAGQRVLLICFNRLLGDWFTKEIQGTAVASKIRSGRFYKCLREVIMSSPVANEFAELEQKTPDSALFGEVYTLYGQLALEGGADRFDVIVMDEAQDLIRQPVLDVLGAWLQGGLRESRWAFFGDFHRQAIFGGHACENPLSLHESVCPPHAKASLMQNCRNTKRIGQETVLMSGFPSPPYRMGQVDGAPVEYEEYSDKKSQHLVLEKVLLRLASERGIEPRDVVVLSRFRLDQSAAADLTDHKAFHIRPIDEIPRSVARVPVFGFATAQAFKGMESKIVVLCDIDRIDCDDDRSFLYVAMSRARSLLTVLLHARTKPVVQDCFKKRMSELWR
jgi:hypothetical protein